MGRSSGSPLEELRWNTPVFSETCLKIVDKRANLVPLIARPWQLRLDDALEAQRIAGKPMRAIILKARQLGFSTWTQAKMIQGATQRQNQRALDVAQDTKTAGRLFDMGRTMYLNLPADVRPVKANQRFSQGEGHLRFSEPGPALKDDGIADLNSSLDISTAKEVETGRGFTWTLLHLSEVAFWPSESKMTALLNAVPDEPGTMVIIESTANGQNHFKKRWDSAIDGDSDYIPIFAAWHEDASYRRVFDSPEEREEFIASIGTGPWGEDEPRLIEEFNCTPEQLRWRRRTITDKCEANVDIFKQEYPASPEDAFLGSGKHVFSRVLVSRVVDRTKRSDPPVPTEEYPGPAVGSFTAAGFHKRQTMRGQMDVPTGAIWTPRAALGPGIEDFWRVFEPVIGEDGQMQAIDSKAQYIVSVDPADDDETTTGEAAFHAIQVINHRTLEQAASYRSRRDADEIALQALFAGIFFNRGWIAVEKTGGHGNAMLMRLWMDYGYPLLYRRKVAPDSKRGKESDRLGWDTNRQTKPMLIDGMKELLREGNHGIKCRLTAHEFTTYIKDDRGRSRPEADAFADLLMAYMIGQQVAREKPVKSENFDQSGRMGGHEIRDPVTGW